MKTTITKTMLIVMIAMVSIMMAAQIAKAEIKNSKHDLSNLSTTTGPASGASTAGTDQICVFCHTPHFASTGAALWNRNGSAVANYSLYNNSVSGTMNASPTQPGGVSAACLSCHDGTVAFDSLLNKPGSGTGAPTDWTFSLSTAKKMDGTNSPSAMLGTDLSNDHPISFVYDAALVTSDGGSGLKDPGALIGVKLYGTKVECASCHNVHEPGLAGSTAPFLRVTNEGSALCLSCHIK